MYKNVNVSTARQNLATIVGDVYFNNSMYYVSKSNVPMVRIERVVSSIAPSIKSASEKSPTWEALGNEIFGSWKNVKDPVAYGRKLRKELELGI